MRNLALAFRTLFKSPFVTGVAILSLALGIGANAAIYSLFEQMLLRPLPVAQPERIVNLGSPGPKQGSTSCNRAGSCDVIFSYPMFRDLEAADLPFTGIAAHRLFGANLAFDGQTLTGEGLLVSGSYFEVLGLRPATGRLISREDDTTIGGHPIAVLGHHFWQNRLGGSADVVGRTITVNGQPLTIIGVAPRGFAGTTLSAQPQVYVPITMREAVTPGWRGLDNRRNYWTYLFARLAPGVSMAQAETAINAVYAGIINDVEAPLQQGLSEQTMSLFRARRVTLEDGRRGQSQLHADVRTPLLLLFATTGIVLLIACANVANLLLARGANRGLEMAIRLSLGARRRIVLRQLLTESVLLAALGGLASLLVARATLGALIGILPAWGSEMLEVSLRPGVIAFTATLSIGTGLLFGMFPALQSTRPDLVTTLRANAGNLTVSRAASRFRSVLVTGQIALSMMLLVVAGLFLKSLVNIGRTDLGQDLEQVVTFQVAPELSGYTPERSRVLFERLEEELAAIPGVSGVTSAMVPILSGNNWGNDVNVEGFVRNPDTDANARLNRVSAGFFATLDIPLIAGREFTLADAAGGARVAVVNEAFARKFNLGSEAVGKWMSVGSDELDMQIVGLVRDAKYSDVKDVVPPLYFTPWRQDENTGQLAFYVRTAIDPAQITRAIPGVVASLDPNLPIDELKTMPQQVRENVFIDRMISTLSAAFALLATLLAAVGLYGVLAYTVERRTREVGVRMALGANARNVQGMVLGQVGRMMLVGGVIGTAAALAIGRAAASLLYGLEGNDPVVIAAAGAVLSLFALGAGFIPAWKASRVDPIRALRTE